jgi:hypothetical protein
VGEKEETAMKTLRTLPALLLSLGLLSSAHAQEAPAEPAAGSWKFAVSGLFGGQWFLDNNFSAQGFELSEVETLWGWQVAYRFHSNWSLEGGWTGSKSRAILVQEGLQADVDPMFLNGNLVFHIPALRKLGPYVTGGLGVAVLDIDRGEFAHSEVNLAGNFGGGFLMPLTQLVSFRTDIRTFIFSVGELDSDSAAALGVAEGRLDETIRDLKFTAGISLTF